MLKINGKDFLLNIERAAIDIKYTFPVTPPGVQQKIRMLLDGASNDMTVDGDAAVTDFELAPPVDKVYLVTSIPLILVDDGEILSPDNFAGRAVLNNGMELHSSIQRRNEIDEKEVVEVIDTVICNIKNNKDLLVCFFGGILGSGGNQTTGFFDTADFATGAYVFESPLILNGKVGDKLFIRIQDDLSDVGHLEAAAKFIELDY